jgi:hypothetical protein
MKTIKTRSPMGGTGKATLRNGYQAVARAQREWIRLLSSKPPLAHYPNRAARDRARFYRFAAIHEILGLDGADELRMIGDFLTR